VYPAAAPQLLVNPGFDQGSTTFSSAGGLISGIMPNSWRDNSDWATPTPSLVYSLSTSVPRTAGSGNSACVQVTSGFAQLVQSITIKVGTDYSMSAWFRVVTVAASASVSLALQANFPPYDWWGSADATVSTASGWSLVTVSKLYQLPQPPSGTVSTSVPALVILRVNTPTILPVTVCMDDAMLQEAGKCHTAQGGTSQLEGAVNVNVCVGSVRASCWLYGCDCWALLTDWCLYAPAVTSSQG
jgi:hypothetical protein